MLQQICNKVHYEFVSSMFDIQKIKTIGICKLFLNGLSLAPMCTFCTLHVLDKVCCQFATVCLQLPVNVQVCTNVL